MTRNLAFAAVAAAILGACSSQPKEPKDATCSQNADCPRDAICVSGTCQTGVPSGGGAGTVAGSARLTAGSMTMDAVVGAPITPGGAGAGRTMKPAENTR